MNSLTLRQMRVDVPALWQRFSDDDAALVAVITGAGDRAFCAGLDVRSAVDGDDGGDGPILISPRANGVMKPVIGAINGVCTGVGVQLAADCDFLVASEEAYFSDARTSRGIMAAMGSVELTRVLPAHEVLRMTMLGAEGRLTAARAHQLGFVNELVPAEQLQSTVERLAAAVMLNAPLAVRLTNQAIWDGLDRGLADGIEHAWEILEANPTTEDMAEGTRAFVEKRRPEWKLR